MLCVLGIMIMFLVNVYDFTYIYIYMDTYIAHKNIMFKMHEAVRKITLADNLRLLNKKK